MINDYLLTNAIAYAILGLIFFNDIKLATFKELSIGFFGGLTDILGTSLLGLALTIGPGGPVQSLVLLQTIV